MYIRDQEKIVVLRLPNMDLKVSSYSSRVMLSFGYCYSVLFHSAKLSNSKFWVKYTSREIIYLKEV